MKIFPFFGNLFTIVKIAAFAVITHIVSTIIYKFLQFFSCRIALLSMRL